MAASSYHHSQSNKTFTGATRPSPRHREQEWERLELSVAARPARFKATSPSRSRTRPGSRSRSHARLHEWELEQQPRAKRQRWYMHPLAQILVSFCLINVGLILLIMVLQSNGFTVPAPFNSLPFFGFGFLVGIPLLCTVILLFQHRAIFHFEGGQNQNQRDQDQDYNPLEVEDELFALNFDDGEVVATTDTRQGRGRNFVPPPPPSTSTPTPTSPATFPSTATWAGSGSSGGRDKAAPSAQNAAAELEAEADRLVAGRLRQHYQLIYRGDNSETEPFEVLQDPTRYQAQFQPGEWGRLEKQIARAVAAKPAIPIANGPLASASRLPEQRPHAAARQGQAQAQQPPARPISGEGEGQGWTVAPGPRPKEF